MAQAKANPLALQKHLDLVPSSAAESVLEPVSDLVLAPVPDYRFHSAPVSALLLVSRSVSPLVPSLALPSASRSVPPLALSLVPLSASQLVSPLVPSLALQSVSRSASPLAPLSVLPSASRSASPLAPSLVLPSVSRSASPLVPLSVLPSVSRSVPHSDSETLLFLYLFLLPHPDAPGKYSLTRFRSLSDRTLQSHPLSCCRRSSDRKRTHLYCRSSSRHN